MHPLIHGGAFKRHSTSRETLLIPAMLGEEERRVLSYLALNLATSEGKIVDLGCYLGGSTRALTEGVRRSGVANDPNDPIVVSYDLFVSNAFMVDHSLKAHGIGVGEPFQKVFRTLLGKNASYVREVAGDILKQSWNGRPIDLLFVDILWSWEINQHVVSQFYTALIAGRSVIVHQDYVYSFYPWLPISMEYLAERGFVEFGDLARWGTVLFGVVKELDEQATRIDFQRDLDLSTKERFLTRSSERFAGYPRGVLKLSLANLLASEGRRDDALSLVREVGKQYAGDEIVETHLRMIHQHLGLEQPDKRRKVDPPHARRSPWGSLGRILARRR